MKRHWPLAGTLLLWAGLAVYPALDERGVVAPLVILGLPALGLYAAAAFGLWADGLAVALGLLALEYMLSIYLRGAVLDLRAPAYAGALFLSAELGWLAFEGSQGARPWPSRCVAIAVLSLAGAGAGFAILAVAALPVPGGVLLTAMGGAAVLGICLALGRLAGGASSSTGSSTGSIASPPRAATRRDG